MSLTDEQRERASYFGCDMHWGDRKDVAYRMQALAEDSAARLQRLRWAATENEWVSRVEIPAQLERCEQAFADARLAYAYYLESI